MDCCHCQKTKHRSDEEQKRLTHRLNLSLIHISEPTRPY